MKPFITHVQFPAFLLAAFVMAAIALLHHPVNAQQTESEYAERSPVIKANTLSLFTNGFSLFYEQEIRPSRSLQLGVYTGTIGAVFQNYANRYRSFTPELRFYLSSPGPLRGFFVGPYLKYQQIRRIYEYDSSLDENSSGFGGGITLGNQWVKRRGFVMDVFVGGGYFLVRSSFEKTKHAAPGFDARLGFSLGYGFKRKM